MVWRVLDFEQATSGKCFEISAQQFVQGLCILRRFGNVRLL